MTIIITISEDTFQCTRIGKITLETSTGLSAQIQPLVVSELPLGVDIMLGIAGIEALGGVVVKLLTDVQFCGTGQWQLCGAAAQVPLVVDAPDFSLQFNTACQSCTVMWKWTRRPVPDCLNNTMAQYVSPSMRQEFNQEMEPWIKSCWLVPYNKQQHRAP